MTRTGMLVLGVIAIAALLASCSSNDKGAATATPVPNVNPTLSPATATPVSFESCPDVDRAVCALAADIEAALVKYNGDEAAKRFVDREVTCQPNDPFSPRVCDGKTPGTKVRGYDVGRTYSEGTTLDRAALVKLLAGYQSGAIAEAKDDYGEGSVRLYSIGVYANPNCPGGCRELVFSRVVVDMDRLFREGILFTAEKRDGTWVLRLVLNGLQLGQDIPVKLRGGTLNGVQYRVWNPKDGGKPVGQGKFWFGSIVRVKGSGDCLNFRTLPNKTAPVVECLKDGAQLHLIGGGGPPDGDGVRWWRVVRLPANTAAGWVSGEFLGEPE